MQRVLGADVLEESTFRSAISALRAGRIRDAEPLLKAVLGMRPTHVGALSLLGVVLMQLGQLNEAEDYLHRALKQGSPSDVTLYNSGLVLKSLGRPVEALERFTPAWAGVPLITCLGSGFASRVAASLLKAVGLDELITHSLQEYEALALKLANDSGLMRALRKRLAYNRTTHPLFDTERFTRHIESAYATMWHRY